MQLANDYLGFKVQCGHDFDLSGYPMIYHLSYRITRASIGGEACLFVIPKGPFELPSLIKLVTRLQDDFAVPCVVVCHELSSYQIKRLSEIGVGWIRSEETYFLPFLGIAIRDAARRTAPTKALSRKAQRIVAHIIDGSWTGKSTTEVARLLGTSLSSASGYFKEIEAIAPEVIGSQGRRRFIAIPPGRSTRMLFDTFEPYLSSPASERAYLKRMRADGESLIDRGCFYAGITALGKATMLDDDPWTAYATSRSIDAFLRAYPDEFEVVTKRDDPDVLLEVWPGGIDGIGDTVGGLQLYLSLRDEADVDPRLEGALDELLERICGNGN